MKAGDRIKATADDRHGGFLVGDVFEVVQESDGLAFVDRDGESRHLRLHQNAFEVVKRMTHEYNEETGKWLIIRGSWAINERDTEDDAIRYILEREESPALER